LTAVQTQSIKVSPGEQLIECASTDDSGVKAEQTKTVAAGVQAVVVLTLSDAIAGKQREAQQRAVAESAARNPGNLGFVDQGGGILMDTKSGLEWTQTDNGADIDWNGARNHCGSRGGSWRLPSVAELLAIYDANVPAPIVCFQFKSTTYVCKVSQLFQLTGVWYWSNETSGASEAFGVYFLNGDRNANRVGSTSYKRALCVRRP
jgi:hypothetical protein